MNTTTITTTAADTLDGLKQKLAQLTDLHSSNVLSTAQFEEAKATLERRIVELVMSGATIAPAPAPVPTAAAPSTQTAATPATPQMSAPAAARPSLRLVAGMAVGVVVIAVAGYFWKGSPAGWAGDNSGGQAAPADGKAAPHKTDADQIAAMTEKLAERLKDKPDDADGWTMLGRSYSVLGRHADALKAYAQAAKLRKDDPTVLADYADSLAVNNNSDLTGEPMKLVDRALKIDPNNLKALYLAGTHAFNTKDFATAVKVWEKMVAISPPGNAFSQQVEPAIAEARKLAGMPAAAKPLDAVLPGKAANGAGAGAVGGATATNANATVSGTVTLSAALAKQAQPDDTVFVFARASEGSRMPLAILRKQVKDLPLTFKLDDSMAMSPANALSSAGKIIVSARVSKSGNAMPQPGDLTGQTAPVDVGATGLKIEIKETVKP
jgi:cytochrome c-type biogenesis protein CcmH